MHITFPAVSENSEFISGNYIALIFLILPRLFQSNMYVGREQSFLHSHGFCIFKEMHLGIQKTRLHI